jgi:hypothetical protein
VSRRPLPAASRAGLAAACGGASSLAALAVAVRACSPATAAGAAVAAVAAVALTAAAPALRSLAVVIRALADAQATVIHAKVRAELARAGLDPAKAPQAAAMQQALSAYPDLPRSRPADETLARLHGAAAPASAAAARRAPGAACRKPSPGSHYAGCQEPRRRHAGHASLTSAAVSRCRAADPARNSPSARHRGQKAPGSPARRAEACGGAGRPAWRPAQGGSARAAKEAIMGCMPADPEDIARMVWEALTAIGLRDRTKNDEGGDPGGFQVLTGDDGEVVVDWLPSFMLFDEAENRHASHPLGAFEWKARAIMNRAVVSVLEAAGFTVTLHPAQDGIARITVTAAPQIRPWAAV